MLSPREPMEHELKCWPEYYDAVECGDKPFEIRKWDRPYRVEDTVLLRRYDPSAQDYTGQQMRRKITYLLDLTYLPGDNIPHFAGYVAIGLDDPRLMESQRRERAAVEDIKLMLYSQKVCFACKNLIPCRNRDTATAYCDPDWRGPQDAKGEAR